MIAWDGEETRFLKVITIFFNIEEMDSVLSLSHQWAWRNRKLKWIKTDGIDYPLMRFQFWNMFEDPELGLKGSSLWVYLVVVNQGCCRSSQYILLDSMLWLDANIQPWIKFMYYLLLLLAWHTRVGISISHLSIPGILVHGMCYIYLFFFFRSLFLTNFLLNQGFFLLFSLLLLLYLLSFLLLLKCLLWLLLLLVTLFSDSLLFFEPVLFVVFFLYCLDLTVKVSNLLCLLVCLFVLFLELKSFDKDLQPHYFFLVSEKVKVLLIFYEYLFLVLLFVVAINFITYFSLTDFMAISSE